MPPDQKPLAEAKTPQPAPSQPLKQIRTFQGDVADALSHQKESLFSIQQTERVKQGYVAPVERAPRDQEKSLLLFVGSLLLIAFAGVGGWYTYGEFVRKTAPPVATIPASQVLVPESSRAVNTEGLSRDALFAAIDEAAAGTPAGTLRHIVLTSGTSTVITTPTSAFLAMLQSRAPSSLVRAFDPVFMLGAIGLTDPSAGESRFLIVKLNSFQSAFGGMLAWEVDLARDLSGLFTRSEELKTFSSSSVFTDVVYKNKDARVLAASSTPVLLYSFFDNEALIITDRPETLQALIDRLTREKLTR